MKHSQPAGAEPTTADTSRGGESPWAATAGRVVPWLVALLVVVGYGIAVWPNDFVYDDVQVILEQTAPAGIADVAHYFAEEHFPGLSYYRPVTRSTLLVQKALHGDVARPFHLFNAALAGALFLLAYALLRRRPFSAAPMPALLAAALFALHPLASSCVYPAASGRETMLPAVLSLAALYTFLRDGRGWTVAAVATFALALFSKEQAVTLPPLFLLAELLGLAERDADTGGRRRRWWRWGAMAVTLVGYFAIRRALFGGAEFRWSVFSEPLGPVVSMLFGLQATVAPFAALRYEPPLAVWWSPLRLALALAVLAVLAWAALRRWPKLRPLALFCAAFFVVTQAPTANILVQEAKFSERYVFLGVFGLLALSAVVLSQAWDRPAARRAGLAVGLALVALSAAVSWHRAVYFRDDLAFAEQWARSNPTSSIAEMGIAAALVRRGEPEASLEHYQRAIDLDPDYADAYFNLGNTLADLGRREPAERAYREALAHKAELPQAYLNLGRLARLDGRPAAAVEVLRRGLDEGKAKGAVAAELRLVLADALADLGRPDEAVVEYRRSLEQNPGSAQAYYALGTTLLAQGRDAEATAALERAVALDPEHGEAHVNLGAALAQAGRYDEALGHYQAGVRLRPGDPAAQLNYGVLLMVLGRSAEALTPLQKGVELSPGEPRARFLLGQALEQTGRTGEALVQYREASALAPDFAEAKAAVERLAAGGS